MYYDLARNAYRTMKSGLERILEPRGLTLNFDLQGITEKIEEEIGQVQLKMESRTGEQATENLVLEIIEERKAKGYKPKSVEDRIEEFASLNDRLLSERMVYDKAVAVPPKVEEKDPDLIEMEKILEESRRIEELIKEFDQISGKAA